MTAAKTDEEKALEAQQEIQWRSAALNAAQEELGLLPTSTPEDRSEANKKLLKTADQYFKFFASSKGNTDAQAARTNALQTARAFPIDGQTTLERAQDILHFLLPA